MKRSLLALLLLASSSGCVSQAPAQPTLPAKHAIVNDRFQLTESALYWTPSTDDIAVLENEMSQLWVRPDRRVSGRLETPLSNFIVRYYGEMKNGRRIVVGEGQHLNTGDAADFLGEKPGMMVTAFGSSRFVVRFDPATRRVIKLEVLAASM